MSAFMPPRTNFSCLCDRISHMGNVCVPHTQLGWKHHEIFDKCKAIVTASQCGNTFTTHVYEFFDKWEPLWVSSRWGCGLRSRICHPVEESYCVCWCFGHFPKLQAEDQSRNWVLLWASALWESPRLQTKSIFLYPIQLTDVNLVILPTIILWINNSFFKSWILTWSLITAEQVCVPLWPHEQH